MCANFMYSWFTASSSKGYNAVASGIAGRNTFKAWQMGLLWLFPFYGRQSGRTVPPFLPASFVLQYPQVTKLPKYNSKEERFLKQNTKMDLVANREVCDR